MAPISQVAKDPTKRLSNNLASTQPNNLTLTRATNPLTSTHHPLMSTSQSELPMTHPTTKIKEIEHRPFPPTSGTQLGN